MRRTLQTADIGLGWLIERGVNVLPHAGWQENSAKPCDTGSPIADMEAEFPQFDFSSVDRVYPNKTSPRSNPYAFTRAAVVARGQTCLGELYHRPEKVIAVVSHSGFLRASVSQSRYANADYRVFDFVEPDSGGEPSSYELKQWEMTELGGGGMGRSERGTAGIKPDDFPEELGLEEAPG